MNKTLHFIFPILILSSCNLFTKKPKVDTKLIDEKIKMMDADKAFSKLSAEKGMKTAFMEYIDSNGVLLRPNEMPIIGANAIDYLSQQEDKEYTLIWEPQGGTIAQSGELGYTYGIYKMQPKTIDTIMYGTYISIWKKQDDGSWRFVLDSGNEGLSVEEKTATKPN
jgi:ketosteroid isomerase-like protein